MAADFFDLKANGSLQNDDDMPIDLVLPPDREAAQWLSTLEPTERAVIVLHYKWGLDLKEIGDCFGFSESRACRIKQQALESMRGTATLKARSYRYGNPGSKRGEGRL